MTKFLKGECTHCAGHLEFPAEAAGMTANCPHCGKQTDLLLAQPKDEPVVPKSMLVWTAIAILLLVGGLGATIYALKLAQRRADERKKQTAVPAQPPNSSPTPADATPDSIAQAGFRLSEVKLEKAHSVVHAVGTLENLSTKTRYGVKIEFDVFDADGKKIGTAQDSVRETIEPGAKWAFRALVLGKKAASVKATGVSEQQ
jgi:hypothetical protein